MAQILKLAKSMTWNCPDCGHENCEHSRPRERAAKEWGKDPMASTRTIAERARVDQKTAHRSRPTEAPEAPASRGRDGKTYPAKRKPAAAEPQSKEGIAWARGQIGIFADNSADAGERALEYAKRLKSASVSQRADVAKQARAAVFAWTKVVKTLGV